VRWLCNADVTGVCARAPTPCTLGTPLQRIGIVELQALQTMLCRLTRQPSTVLSYDFVSLVHRMLSHLNLPGMSCFAMRDRVSTIHYRLFNASPRLPAHTTPTHRLH
jgi:hypothetical protein